MGFGQKRYPLQTKFHANQCLFSVDVTLCACSITLLIHVLIVLGLQYNGPSLQ